MQATGQCLRNNFGVLTGRMTAVASLTFVPRSFSSSSSQNETAPENSSEPSGHKNANVLTDSAKKPKQTKKKTMAQLDEEMRLAMEGRAGDGGESGVELEDGKPVSMKRGVRDNMFRYI